MRVPRFAGELATVLTNRVRPERTRQRQSQSTPRPGPTKGGAPPLTPDLPQVDCLNQQTRLQLHPRSGNCPEPTEGRASIHLRLSQHTRRTCDALISTRPMLQPSQKFSFSYNDLFYAKSSPHLLLDGLHNRLPRTRCSLTTHQPLAIPAQYRHFAPCCLSYASRIASSSLFDFTLYSSNSIMLSSFTCN